MASIIAYDVDGFDGVAELMSRTSVINGRPPAVVYWYVPASNSWENGSILELPMCKVQRVGQHAVAGGG
jgi:hypothetical protein